MSASLNFFSLTPQTLSLHHHSSSSSAASSLLAPPSLKPLPKLVLSLSSVGSYAVHPTSRFVRRVVLSELDEDVEEGEDEEEDEGSDFSGSDEPNFSADVKLFVGNLPFTVDSSALATLFERAGNVEMVEVIYDKGTGRSRGFGFVTMSSVEEAEAAVQQFNGYEFQGRMIRVNSGPPPPKSESSFRDSRENSSFRGSRDNSSFRGSRDNSSFRGSRDNSSFRGSRDNSYGGSRDNSSYGGSRDNSSYGGSRENSSYGGSRENSYGGGSRGGSSSDSSNRVYVGNLAWGVDNLTLETLFSEQGRVQDAAVVYDRESGRSRGFGFVTYGSSKEVDNAINSLDGMDLNGRSIRVSRAEARQKREY